MTELITPATDSTPTETLPGDLDSPAAKLVYLYLARAGPTTISDLSAALDMRMLSLYSVLDALSGEELVDNDGETYGVQA